MHLLSPAGFRAAGVYAGIRTKHAPDVAMLLCDSTASAAAAFTTNRVVSASIVVGRQHIAAGKLRGIVINAGNANACTGKQGLADAKRMAVLAARVAGCKPAEILPCSTGIIGHMLPMLKIERGIADVGQYLGNSLEHANLFADAILTTDTKRKTAATQITLNRKRVTIAGVCKGSGMIGPRIAVGAKHATMLAYLTTDAAVPTPLLRKLLQQTCDVSFNTVTVDDHASTNDTAAILASGLSGARVSSSADSQKFAAAMKEVCQSLAYQIAADGEGASKVVTIIVRGGKDDIAARVIARTIANSPLVKTAMHGNDPNWGRLISAAGYAGAPLDPQKCVLKLAGTVVFRAGRAIEFDRKKVSAAMAAKEVIVDLDCRLGRGEAKVWTCDLSKEYISINADYHT